MSVEFELVDNRLSLKNWQQLLARWSEKQPITLYDPPELDVEDAEPFVQIWGEGSIRGFSLRFKRQERRVRLRLSALASRTDWAMAYSLLKAALSNGGGELVREGQARVPIETLSLQEAHRNAVVDFCASTQAFAHQLKERGLQEMELPVGLFQLPCRMPDLGPCTPDDMEVFERALARRVNRYATAFRCHTAVMRLKGDREIRLSIWSLVPTLLDDVDVVAIEYEGSFQLPKSSLLRILGERVEPLGGKTFYLPELDPAKPEDLALLKKLKQARVPLEDIPAKDRSETKGQDQAGPEPDPEELKSAAMATKVAEVMALLTISREDPKDIKARLLEKGLDGDAIDAVMRTVLACMRGLLVDKKPAEEVYQDLLKASVSPLGAQAILGGVIRALERPKGP